MQKIILSIFILFTVSARAQNQAVIIYNQSPNKAIFLNVSNPSQVNNFGNLFNDNNINPSYNKQITHLFTRSKQPVNNTPSTQKQTPRQANEKKPMQQMEANQPLVENIQPLPQWINNDNIINVQINTLDNVPTLIQQDFQPQVKVAEIKLPQLRIPTISLSTSALSSSSTHRYKRNNSKWSLRIKRKVQKYFSGKKQHKSNPVSCFNWSKG